MKNLFILQKNLRFFDNPFLEEMSKINKDIYFCCSLTDTAYSLVGENVKFSPNYITIQEASIKELKRKTYKNWQYNLPVLNKNIMEIVNGIFSPEESFNLFLEYPLSIKNIFFVTEIKKKFKKVKIISIWAETLFKKEETGCDLNNFPKSFSKFRKEVFSKASWPTNKKDEAKKPNFFLDHIFFNSQIQKFDKKEHDIPFTIGEDGAHEHLRKYIWKNKSILTYKETRNQMLGNVFSSRLSHYLAHGNISPCFIYREIKRFEKEEISNESTQWLVFELLWREFLNTKVKKNFWKRHKRKV